MFVATCTRYAIVCTWLQNDVAGERVHHVRDILGRKFEFGLRTLKPENLKNLKTFCKKQVFPALAYTAQCTANEM